MFLMWIVLNVLTVLVTATNETGFSLHVYIEGKMYSR